LSTGNDHFGRAEPIRPFRANYGGKPAAYGDAVEILIAEKHAVAVVMVRERERERAAVRQRYRPRSVPAVPIRYRIPP
jgi:hypothetical protein